MVLIVGPSHDQGNNSFLGLARPRQRLAPNYLYRWYMTSPTASGYVFGNNRHGFKQDRAMATHRH